MTMRARSVPPVDPNIDRYARREAIARSVARAIWERLPLTDQILLKDRWSIGELAVVDDRIDAMQIVSERPGEHVEFIEANHRHGNLWRYSAHGRSTVLTDRQLMMVAGLAGPVEPDFDEKTEVCHG